MHRPPLHAIAFAGLSLAASLSAQAAAAVAAGPSIVAGSVNMFRDYRGANSVGVGAGDKVQFGANIIGGAADVSIVGISATGFRTVGAPCGPLAVNANFCAAAVNYNALQLAPWTFEFTRAGQTTSVIGPSLAGVPRVPFPTSVTLSGSGATPTISWQTPASFTPDGFRVQVFDKNVRRANGAADIILSTSLAPTATTFTLPASLGLSPTGNYAINFQEIQTRGHVAFTNNNAEIFSRSNSFFDFAPLGGRAPSEVALPTLDASGVYNFSVGSVGRDKVTFIDPLVATGYHYATGAGDPNFLSVLLPNVGDGIYTLDYSDVGGAHSTTLLHGTQFFFTGSGVSAFTVSGIETAAGLDPTNATAFITGLTFTGAGAFTGTMTPITVFVPVPEPQTWALLLGGLALIGGTARRSAQRGG